MKDFTLSKYEEILISIKDKGLPVYGICSWILKKPKEGFLMRHDVDRLPANALQKAELESKFGIYTTYYFRIVRSSFNVNVIKAIENLGHEIGYHYEDLSLSNGNYREAIKLFEKNLAIMREVAKIKTIAMHGRPLSKMNNIDMWQKYDFKQFDIIGDAFLSIAYSDMVYFTDTGRTWSSNAINLRDKVEGIVENSIESSNDLIKYLSSTNIKKIAIVSHPERWNNKMAKWLSYALFDYSANSIKFILKNVR